MLPEYGTQADPLAGDARKRAIFARFRVQLAAVRCAGGLLPEELRDDAGPREVATRRDLCLEPGTAALQLGSFSRDSRHNPRQHSAREVV